MAIAKPDKIAYPFRKVSQETIDAILKDIREGGTRKHSAEAHGISDRHFHNLVAQGIIDNECGKSDTLQANMVRSLREIELNEIKECRTRIKKYKTSHKGSEWTLEHVYWRWYGNSSEVKELAEEIKRLKDQLEGVKSDEQVDD